MHSAARRIWRRNVPIPRLRPQSQSLRRGRWAGWTLRRTKGLSSNAHWRSFCTGGDSTSPPAPPRTFRTPNTPADLPGVKYHKDDAQTTPTDSHPSTTTTTTTTTTSTSQSEQAVEDQIRQLLRQVAPADPREPSGASDCVQSGDVESLEVRGDPLRPGAFIVSVGCRLSRGYRALKSALQSHLSGHLPADWQVRVHLAPSVRSLTGDLTASEAKTPSGLSTVRNIIAVSSCKGGVGKSTVAVNLAYALSQQDLSVGVFDADLYGPSLPTLVSPKDIEIRESTLNPGMLAPPTFEGVKCMSFGYVAHAKSDSHDSDGQTAGCEGEGDSGNGLFSPDAGLMSSATVMRGPMVSQVLWRMLHTTEFGDLDYLIVDLPPGTGDIAITFAQNIPITGSVVVTTPQLLSYVDVEKGMEMWSKVNVPVISVVENMHSFQCPECDHVSYPFGHGLHTQPSAPHNHEENTHAHTQSSGQTRMQALCARYGLSSDNVVDIPVHERIAQYADAGDPLVLSRDPHLSAVRDRYLQLAFQVHQWCTAGAPLRSNLRVRYSEQERGFVLEQPGTSQGQPGRSGDAGDSRGSGGGGGGGGGDVGDSGEGAVEVVGTLPARQVRLACRCVLCVDDATHKPLLDSATIPDTVAPSKLESMGNYAVGVSWDDGHRSVYPLEALRELIS